MSPDSPDSHMKIETALKNQVKIPKLSAFYCNTKWYGSIVLQNDTVVLYYKMVRYWLKIRSKKKTEFMVEIELGPSTIEGQILKNFPF